ncbi:hypothetical protein GALMADRAFT_46308, partial [Galerina marginata CBS 339.88]
VKNALSPQEIRDKIMDPTSEFQRQIVEYLESVHIGEFLTGSKDEVEDQINIEKSENKKYQDPTQTLPDAPPSLCNDKACDNCLDCEALESWWEKFRKITDDLIFKSNVHTCRKQSDKKSDKKDRPGCINKHGNCKARFPRKIVDQTEVDPKTGALNIKKGEAWINTLTPALTYLLRCNTDVTSLLSGTAVKAIVAYISDYVSKPGLKTYSIFDTIKSVFTRNTEMLGGSLDQKEKARRLITQTVNSLTGKMEIGGPMAALYLLGNPDHYTSHKFVPVYWKNYVREVLKSWRSEEDLEDTIEEKLVIQKNKDGKYIGFSTVHDYMYRPKIFENITLYEWVQKSSRFKAPSSVKHDKITSEDELDLFNQESDKFKVINSNFDESGIEYSEDEDELNIHSDDEFIDEENLSDNETETDTESEVENNTNKNSYLFLKDHPLYKTHKAHFDDKKNNIIPNFVGGSLPRCDRGDREYYCATMLTIFKPWRSGKDLKLENYSWDETFNTYKFTEQQELYMKNFNVRYECNDARDDFSAQLKKGNTEELLPQWMNSDALDDIDSDHDFEGAEFGDDEPDNEEHIANKYSELGRTGKRNLAEMEATRISVTEAGWLDNSPNGLENIDKNPIQPDIIQQSSKWKASVDQERQKVLTKKAKNIPPKSQRNMSDPNENNVQVVDRSYLRKKFKAKLKADRTLIKTIVDDFSLNTEQERAFRIIANHSVE